MLEARIIDGIIIVVVNLTLLDIFTYTDLVGETDY